MNTRSEPAGLASVAAASVQFGVLDVLARVVGTSGTPIPPFLATRYALTAALLLATLAARRATVLVGRSVVARLLALGLVGNALQSALFFYAVRRSGAAAVTLIFFVYPVWVVVLSVATGERLPVAWVGGALALSVTGTSLVFVSEHGHELTAAGALLALGSSLTYAVYLVAAGRWMRQATPQAATLWSSVGAAAGLGVVAILGGAAGWPASGRPLELVLANGVLGGLAYLCLFAGLARAGVVGVSLVSTTEALAAAVFAALFLHEPLPPVALLGGAMILGGAVLAATAGGGRGAGRAARPG